KNIEIVNESAINAKELVMDFLESCERKDFKSARNYISDNISYRGPTGMGSFDKAESYLKYLEHLDLPKADIKKVFENGNDICEVHEMKFGTLPEPTFVCSWFHVDDGKISSIRVLFDPRPFLQEKR